VDIGSLESCSVCLSKHLFSERGDLTPPPPFPLSTYSDIKLPDGMFRGEETLWNSTRNV